MTECDSVYKIVVIGTPATRIATLFEQNQTELQKDNIKHTSEEFTCKAVNINYLDECHTLHFTYWNFFPHDWKKDRESKKEFYRDVEGAVLVCDYGYSDSLVDVKAWKDELEHFTSKTIPTIFLCIKSENEVVRFQMVQQITADLKLKHYETSISNPKLIYGLSKILIKEIIKIISGTPYLLKIIIIGAQNKYKTSFVRNYADHFSDGDNFKTLGHFPGSKIIRVKKKLVKLILMDIDGREFFGKLRPNYYRGASACVIVFDKSDRKSFAAVPDWLEEFRKHIPSPDIPIVILGIRSKGEDVSSDEGKAIVEQLDLTYFETFSPTFENSNEVFEYLAQKVIE